MKKVDAVDLLSIENSIDDQLNVMSHLMIRVTNFEIVGDYTLRVVFEDETQQTINFEPVLAGYYLGPLRDLNLFNQVRLDSDFHTLVWPNEADFDPATLYNRHHGDGEELARRASKWQQTALGQEG